MEPTLEQICVNAGMDREEAVEGVKRLRAAFGTAEKAFAVCHDFRAARALLALLKEPPRVSAVPRDKTTVHDGQR